MIKTSALLSAVALVGAVTAERASVLYPHVPLVLWSQRGTFNAQQTYVNAVVDDKETLNVLHNVLTRDTDKDVYNVLSRDASAEPAAEALCVFVHATLKPAQLAELGADSYVQTAIKSATSSVVIAHTTRSQSLTQGLTPVDHAVVAIDDIAAWIQSTEGQKLLTNGKTDLVVVQIPEAMKIRDVDAKIKTAANALLTAAHQRIDFALTGDAAQPLVVKDPFNSARRSRSRRLAAGQNVTAASIICDAGYLVGVASNGKAYCFSHFVHMTPEVLTALLFGFFFLFLAYVGISVLHAIQTPQRYPLHAPPKGKEF